MKNKKTYNHIKNKIQNHEFEFDPHAWNNMEHLLNAPTIDSNHSTQQSKSYFFIKMTVAMLLILIIFYLGWPSSPITEMVPTEPIATLDITPTITQNGVTTQAPTQPISTTTKKDKTSVLAPIAIRQNDEAIVFNPMPDIGGVKLRVPFAPEKKDPKFFEKAKQKLAEYQKSYAPEKVYVHTDKHFYEPGDRMWFSVYVRDANTLEKSDQSDIVYVELVAPNGNVEHKLNLVAKNGQAAGDIQFTTIQKGGIYKIRAYTNWMRNLEEVFERDITVQNVVLPNLRMNLDFEREAYGAGAMVVARLDMKTLENAPLGNHTLNFVASIAGKELTKSNVTTDANGIAKVQFTLPKNLKTNDGLLNVTLAHNGQNESISRSIPIVLNQIDLQFFPEGGDMVAGIHGKVAFKALDEFGKPADVAGEIVDERGKKVMDFKTYHMGMGAVEFTPEDDMAYTAKITQPKNIKGTYDLPATLQRGYKLKVESLFKDRIQVDIASTETEDLYLIARGHGEVYYTDFCNAKGSTVSISIPTEDMPIGMIELTLFDSKKIPRAERLVFVNQHKQLNIEVKTDKAQYLPREKVEMQIAVKDERGIPMPGNFSLAVVDDKVLSFADDKQGHVLSQLLLQSELRGEVEEPNFYFEDPTLHPDKDETLALDHLMLTQGWRRFNWDNILRDPIAAADFDNEKAIVSGVVVDDDNKPMVGVTVDFDGQKLKTGKDGAFSFANVDLRMGARELVVDNGELLNSLVISSYISDMVLQFNDWNSANSQVQYANGRTSLEGVITDKYEEALIGAAIIVYQDEKIVHGVAAGLDGDYKITNLVPGKYDIEVTYTGYESQRLEGLRIIENKRLQLNAQMEESSMLLEEVVVTGYGQKRVKKKKAKTKEIKQGKVKARAFDNVEEWADMMDEVVVKEYKVPLIEQDNTSTGAVQVVTGADIAKLPTRSINAIVATTAGQDSADEEVSIRGSRNGATDYYVDGVRITEDKVLKDIEAGSVSQALKGKVAGISVTKGADKKIVIRGQSSTNKRGSDPLYVLDGVVVSNVKELDPNDIKKIEVLKDEAATNIYGNNGRNGVILITTKSGNGQLALIESNYHTAKEFFTPKYKKNETPEIRTDFRSTIYWNPNVKLDRSGKTTVEFYNNDNITTFKAIIEGLGVDGSVGRGEQTYFTQLPFGMNVKVPTNLLTGDVVRVPLTLANNTKEALNGKLNVEAPKGFELMGKIEKSYPVKANETKVIYLAYKVNEAIANQAFKINFEAKGLKDAFVQNVTVNPRGYPVAEMLSSDKYDHTFNLNVVNPINGSVTMNFEAHPTVLGELVSGLDRMLRQPSGCFEQTSSSNYPNVLAVNYMEEADILEPAIREKSNQYMVSGYNRLTSYEVKGGGFDWYGRSPAHEGLTAYGLMQFVDMSKVYDGVEADLIDRTAKWLLRRKDGEGGWKTNPKHLHRWSGAGTINNAYIAWALTEAGFGSSVKKEVRVAKEKAIESKDAYQLALVANALFNQHKKEEAQEVIDIILKMESQDGAYTGNTFSMTHSKGHGLKVETSALVAMAMMKLGNNYEKVEELISFISSAKTHYGYGSTQSTVLALKALVKYATFAKQVKDGSEIDIFVNGNLAAKKNVGKGAREVKIDNLGQYLVAGNNKINVVFDKKKDALPYDLSINYNTSQPLNDKGCQLKLMTTLSETNSIVGNTVRLTTEVKNTTSETLSNPIAIIGIPAGLTVQPWQMKEYQEKELFDYYEVVDGYVILYYRGLNPRESKITHFDLKADLAGLYEAPASVAYLYYENELQTWSKPADLTIVE